MPHLKHLKIFKYNHDHLNYIPLDHTFEPPISFLSYFLTVNFIYVKKDINKFVVKLNMVNTMSWNDDEIFIDQKENTIYLGIVPDFCCDNYYYEIYGDKIREKSLLQLYKENILDHMIISKNNFIYILYSWHEALNKKIPFLLLYENSKNWFNCRGFTTEREMQNFIANYQDEVEH